jgi:hypothetical protein
MSFWWLTIIYSIATYGASFWLVYGEGPFEIFTKFRNFIEKVNPQLRRAYNCMNCTPAQVGLVLSTINTLFAHNVAFTPFNLLLFGTGLWWVIIPLDAMFTSGIVYLIHTLQEAIETE